MMAPLFLFVGAIDWPRGAQVFEYHDSTAILVVNSSIPASDST
jgi:hypothetical protein